MLTVIGKQVDKVWEKKKGEVYVGTDLYCTYPSQNIEGLGVTKIYFGSSRPCYNDVKALPIGTDIEVYYNQYGKPESFFIVKAPEPATQEKPSGK